MQQRGTKQKLKFALIAVGILVATFGTASCAGTSTKSDSSTPSYLFVFSASGTMMQPVEGATDTYNFAGELDCTAIAECASITWFTDRPHRDSGTQTAVEFVELWNTDSTNSFLTDPPNVAIEIPAHPDTSTGPTTVIATMSDVRLARNQASKGIVILARMTLVPREGVTSLASSDSHISAHTDTAVTSVPAQLGRVSVFVDPGVSPLCVLSSCSVAATQPATTTSGNNSTLVIYSTTFVPFDSSF